MKAGVATENGLALRDIQQPQPKPNEVLVKVRAAALNRADLATARGIPHGSHGGIGAPVGIEWAGEVVALSAIAVQRAQPVELLHRLDALGHDGQPTQAGELDDQTDAVVELSNEAHRSASDAHIAHVTMVVDGRTIRSSAAGGSYQAALDTA